MERSTADLRRSFDCHESGLDLHCDGFRGRSRPRIPTRGQRRPGTDRTDRPQYFPVVAGERPDQTGRAAASEAISFAADYRMAGEFKASADSAASVAAADFFAARITGVYFAAALRRGPRGPRQNNVAASPMPYSQVTPATANVPIPQMVARRWGRRTARARDRSAAHRCSRRAADGERAVARRRRSAGIIRAGRSPSGSGPHQRLAANGRRRQRQTGHIGQRHATGVHAGDYRLGRVQRLRQLALLRRAAALSWLVARAFAPAGQATST